LAARYLNCAVFGPFSRDRSSHGQSPTTAVALSRHFPRKCSRRIQPNGTDFSGRRRGTKTVPADRYFPEREGAITWTGESSDQISNLPKAGSVQRSTKSFHFGITRLGLGGIQDNREPRKRLHQLLLRIFPEGSERG
jgi:hypothetical protein